MKAIAVKPPQKNSVHLVDIPKPELSSVANGRGVLVKVLQVGVDATDREVNDGLYGNSPDGDDFLIIGHEVFGQVLEVGDAVRKVKPGDYVACTVRRPGYVDLRRHRPQRYHQRRSLLRTRHQPATWLPDGIFRR